MKIEESLTKENFWNEIETKYPNAFKIFADWIDEYKKAVDWEYLFNNEDRYAQYAADSSIKFHDIPHAMQLGIWIVFINNQPEPYFIDVNMDVDNSQYNLAEDIENWMRLSEKTIVWQQRQKS